jgi:hypothetical protein
VIVVGRGHSAFNAILDLVALLDSEPAAQVVGAIRAAGPGCNYGGAGDDQLPARGGRVRDGSIAPAAGFQAREVSATGDGLVLRDGDRDVVADEVIAAVGEGNRTATPADRETAVAACCGNGSTSVALTAVAEPEPANASCRPAAKSDDLVKAETE